MKLTKVTYVLTVLAGLGLAACQQDIDVDLPPYEPKLVLECYLEEGQPVRLTLLESRGYLDVASLPLVDGATVVLSHQGLNDTIPNVPFVDRATGKSYNYSSPTPIKTDYDSPYTLTVTDKQGRRLTATTRFIRPVAIKSITPEFNQNGEAYGLTKFDDNPQQKNYYRLTLTRNIRVDTLSLDALLDDAFSNGEEINWGSGYTFKKGDTIHATLYHCTEDYYKFLTTAQSARQANVNPFAASGEVISNVRGGLGVFATLTYDYRSVVIK
ncbi:DUF4249 domain-containing protein [Fibrisoma montanum]|uniref:DUF4249 domain-containing protein n=1 Tax=Fibrisoma montanum TaxID=2305895 RepID=A0A418MCG2_9BACT|nr:DUF4249 domain-containing protein [Fibrisoma montanum]RIV24049.1 DUF4249 domain-containing protein [Fibrisoma montanum]